jgi:hypothetical protein
MANNMAIDVGLQTSKIGLQHMMDFGFNVDDCLFDVIMYLLQFSKYLLTLNYEF